MTYPIRFDILGYTLKTRCSIKHLGLSMDGNVFNKGNMMHKLSKIIVCGLLLATTVNASESLSIDRAGIKNLDLYFPNERNVQPDQSDFEVLNYIFMSSEEGERWVVITIRNNASGTRSINQKHLLGLLASGDRVHPEEFKQTFGASETLTLTLRFGESKFPVLEIYSRQKV